MQDIIAIQISFVRHPLACHSGPDGGRKDRNDKWKKLFWTALLIKDFLVSYADIIEINHLSGQENIHTLRTIIARAQKPRVLFVVPKRHSALQHVVRLMLLGRQSFIKGVQIAFVSKDATVRDAARQVNLSVFRSIKAAQRARNWHEAEAIPSPTDLTPSDLFTRTQRQRAVLTRQTPIGRPTSWGEHVMLAGLVFGMMIVLSSILLLLGPSASIILSPYEEDYKITVPMTVDPTAQEINFGKTIIPGTLITQDVQGTREMPTSGHQDVPVELAKGSVLFINATGQPVNIPTNTILSTSSGTAVRFRTLETVELTGTINSRVSVPIEAISPGPSGNVGPQQVNRVEGAAATVVRVLNEEGMEGGTVEQRSVVTAADQEQLQEQLRQQLLQAGRAALERASEQSAENQLLVPGMITMDVASENFNGVVKDPLDLLRLTMRATVSGLLVSQEDLERVVKREFEEEIPPNYMMLEEKLTFSPNEAQLGELDLPVMPVRAQTRFRAQLSGEQIRTLVRGQPIDEANTALTQHLLLAAQPTIIVTPDWWNRMPYLSLRIFIDINTLEENQANFND